MFDWNDEELTNIIWGEAGAGGETDDDHIVPLPPALLKSKNGIASPAASSDHTTQSSSLKDKDSGIFENPPEGGFVDYGWANIGSFDDLDRIFSNNDQMFGYPSVANADELWPNSSKNETGPPLSSDSSDLLAVEQTETKPIETTYRVSEVVQGSKQKKYPEGQRSSKTSELIHPHSLSSRWSNNSYGQPMVNHQSPPLVLSQQIPRERPMPFHPLNHYSSGFEVPTTSSNSLKNSENASMRPPEMTPKEKVEKLRRRQQMRAIIAIQKQQLQFKNRASGSGHDVDESLVSFPSIEPTSPVEQYDTNTISTGVDNSSLEESVLYRLQDTIAKVDMRTRVCIRDSLFRLAQSAMLRQYPNDSRDEVHSDKDIVSHESCRFTRMPDVETNTNPIDRSVAHLLFHRPLEGKPVETPESPLSANLPCVKNSKSKFPSQLSEGDKSENHLCFLTCKNAIDDENADKG